MRFWFDGVRRLDAAKAFQLARLERIGQCWLYGKSLRKAGFAVDAGVLEAVLNQSCQAIGTAPENIHLLTEEARLSKFLFKLAAHR